MFRINDWNENEKFSLKKIAQDVMDKSGMNMIQTSFSGSMKTSCCIDTTRITAGPCGSNVQTSCCIDTTKE
nr:hypothetical protein [uncultured Methanobrevibacter sp.]